MINFFKNISWIAGGQIISLLGNFALLKILTSSLSTSSFGYYSLWMSVALFFRQVIYDPISIVAAKEAVKNEFLGAYGANGFQIVSYVVDRILIVLTALTLCYFIITLKISEFDVPLVFLAAGVIYLVSNGTQGIYLNMLNATKKRKFSAIGVAADSLMKLFFVAVVIFLFENNDVNTIQAIALSSLLLYLALRYLINIKYTPDNLTSDALASTGKQLLMLSLPFLVPCVLIALKTASDKWFMAAFLGLDELAAYNVLLQLGFIPMMLFVGVIQTYVVPEIYKRAVISNKSERNSFLGYINNLLIRIFLVSVVGVGTSVAFSEFIFNAMIGPTYIDYSRFLSIFVAAGSIAAAAGLLYVAIIGAFKAKTAAWLMFLTVAAGLIIIVVAISSYGFQGGIAGLVLSNFLSLLVFYVYLYNKTPGK